MNATLADLVTAFFVKHLAAERDASSHTIASYRDTLRILLCHTAEVVGRSVSRLTIDDFNQDCILGFLDYLEQKRGNSVRTRNGRLAAIRAFFAYVAMRSPEHAAQAQRVRSIPFKKEPSKLLGYLTSEELRAVLAQPRRTTPQGRRDYLVLALLYDTGARVHELLQVRPADFRLERVSLVRIMGKGRKERLVPLLPVTAKLVRTHLAEIGAAADSTMPLFSNRRGEPMTRSGVAFLLEKYRRCAAEHAPALQRSGISPHTMRHTKAMHLLQAGVSPITIKDILGHEHLKTLDIYVQADLDMKRKAIETTPSPTGPGPRRRTLKPDLLRWLEEL